MYFLSQEVCEELPDDIDICIWFWEFDLNGVIELVDDLAMNHKFAGSLHIPLFEELKVIMFSVSAQLLDCLVLGFIFVHTVI